jgi:hypothetical protein
MGFEIPLDSDYTDHPQTQHLMRLLGKEADVYPIRLWLWASKYARDGKVKSGWRGVEAACRWVGRPKRLSKALVTCGFMESDGETIHDWMDGVGRAITLYELKKKKQRDKYRESVGILPEEIPDSSGIKEEDHRQSSPNPSNPSNSGNPENPDTPPTGGALKSGSVAAQIASNWRAMNRNTMSQESVTNRVQNYLDQGMNAEAALARSMDGELGLGKPWDVFEPLIPPNGANRAETMKEYRMRRDAKDVRKEVDAKFGGGKC